MILVTGCKQRSEAPAPPALLVKTEQPLMHPPNPQTSYPGCQGSWTVSSLLKDQDPQCDSKGTLCAVQGQSVVSDPNTGAVYEIGGFIGNQDLATETTENQVMSGITSWSLAGQAVGGGSLGNGAYRQALAGAAYLGKEKQIPVAGGLPPNLNAYKYDQAMSAAYLYTPSTDTWTADMQTPPMCTPANGNSATCTAPATCPPASQNSPSGACGFAMPHTEPVYWIDNNKNSRVLFATVNTADMQIACNTHGPFPVLYQATRHTLLWNGSGTGLARWQIYDFVAEAAQFTCAQQSDFGSSMQASVTASANFTPTGLVATGYQAGRGNGRVGFIDTPCTSLDAGNNPLPSGCSANPRILSTQGAMLVPGPGGFGASNRNTAQVFCTGGSLPPCSGDWGWHLYTTPMPNNPGEDGTGAAILCPGGAAFVNKDANGGRLFAMIGPAKNGAGSNVAFIAGGHFRNVPAPNDPNASGWSWFNPCPIPRRSVLFFDPSVGPSGNPWSWGNNLQTHRSHGLMIANPNDSTQFILMNGYGYDNALLPLVHRRRDGINLVGGWFSGPCGPT